MIDEDNYYSALSELRTRLYAKRIDIEYLKTLSVFEIEDATKIANYDTPPVVIDGTDINAHEPNLISSKLVPSEGFFNGMMTAHSPALDIDIPIEVYASSTPGHSHLYFPNLKLTWDQYKALLFALKEAGIIEENYYAVSLSRQATQLRFPGAHKWSKEEILEERARHLATDESVKADAVTVPEDGF